LSKKSIDTARAVASPRISRKQQGRRAAYLRPLSGFVALLLSTTALAQPLDPDGNVGATNYKTLPFASNVFGSSWGGSVGLTPMELFYQSNPNSFYYNASDMQSAKATSSDLDAQGIVPISGAQRWDDTFAASFATAFPGEPSWVTADRASGNFPNLPEFAAWRNWVNAHPQYWDAAPDGGTMPTGYRSWGGQWGHISPATPLDAADCPTGMTSCTWGDFFAYRWAETSALTGVYGIQLADYTDSEPDSPSNYQNFNPKSVAAFAAQYGYSNLTGMTTTQQSTWIIDNAFSQWTDYLDASYGHFFGALASRMGAATGKEALVIGGGDTSPGWRRLVGTDARQIALNMDPKNYLTHFDDQVIQVGRQGPVAAPPNQELSGFVVAAAREPLIRNGAMLEADDAAYWQAIPSFYPSLSSSAQKEVGYKLLKRLWLWSSWASIADRSGNVRRALAYISRDYWDVGTLDSIAGLQKLVQGIYPTSPFGAALYYPVSVERAVEQAGVKTVGPNALFNMYMLPNVLQSFLDSGAPVGYYVSDAGLPAIVAGSANAPSAWVVLDANGLLPADEQAKLAAIAPVVTSAAELAALPNQPLTFSAGLSGFGFYSNQSSLVLVVTDTDTGPAAAAVSGTVSLTQLPVADGVHKITDLFTNVTSAITITGGKASLPVQVARWDTQTYALTP
jgi:hypothetical protein